MTGGAREAELDELMARLSGGDRSAFRSLYEELRPRTSRVVASRVPASAVPDVVQTVLMKVYASASEFEAGKPCLPWFYAIVANEIRAARRRDARLVLVESPDDALVETSEPESILVRRELERAVQGAVDSLDEDAANAIRSMLGLAAAPDVPAATFRKRVSRAYARLRFLLGGQNAH